MFLLLFLATYSTKGLNSIGLNYGLFVSITIAVNGIGTFVFVRVIIVVCIGIGTGMGTEQFSHYRFGSDKIHHASLIVICPFARLLPMLHKKSSLWLFSVSNLVFQLRRYTFEFMGPLVRKY